MSAALAVSHDQDVSTANCFLNYILRRKRARSRMQKGNALNAVVLKGGILVGIISVLLAVDTVMPIQWNEYYRDKKL